MSVTEKFISNLSFRLNKENDLSDITWAMCETSDLFLTEFLAFFFPSVDFDEVTLQREVANDDSRPDFYFEYNDKIYLIECKIWDRNHHFAQYTKRFGIPNEQLGYITNYPMMKEGFAVHTWTELYSYLKKRIPTEEKELWNGYLEYLEQVCYIFIPTKPMNTDGMYSLYAFYCSLDEVFACDNNKYKSFLYPYLKGTNNGGNTERTPREGVMGKYFDVTFKHIRLKRTWGWMGVYFEREKPVICIGFDNREGWGKPVYKLLKKQLTNIKKGKYFDSAYEAGDFIWFDFNKVDIFNSLDSPSKQISLLRSYFFEVLDVIYSLKQNV